MKHLKIRDVHGHFLNGWQWFYPAMWRKDDKQIIAQAKKLAYKMGHLRKYKQHDLEIGIPECDGFAFMSDGKPEHQIWNHKTPWVWDKQKKIFLITEFESRWWELAEMWLQAWKEGGCDWGWHLTMGFGYNLLPFQRNNKGIHARHIWDQELRPYLESYFRKLMELYKTVYSDKKNPYAKICNEPAHGGNGHVYHDIMYYHEWAWGILKDYTIPAHTIIDISHCEGSLGEVRDRHRCAKPGECDRGGWHGNDEDDRKFVAELHGFSPWEDYNRKVMWNGKPTPIIDIYLGSKKAPNGRRFTGDGGSYTKSGKGACFPPPESGLPPIFQVGNRRQRRMAARKVFTKAHEKGKRVIICPYPMEGLTWEIDSNGIERHGADYNPKKLRGFFNDMRAMCHEWLKVYHPELIGKS